MPKDMSSVRYSRILKVIACLKRHNGRANRSQLEEAGEYNIEYADSYRQNRTLQNDLKFMREEMKAVIDYDRRENIYILKHEGKLIVNLEIKPEEIEALSAGLKIASHFLPHIEKNASALWEKITCYIPEELVKQGASLAKATLTAIPVEAMKPEVFRVLTDAKNLHKAVKIRYASPGKEARNWILSPYDFFFRGNAWYMISFNHEHNALSTHRISRIIRASFAKDEYIMPEKGGFNENYSDSAWYVSPGNEKIYVKLKLTGRLAETSCSVKWHPSQKIISHSDGSIILTAEVPHLEEIARWVLAGAPNVKVLEPPALKYIVRDMAMSVIDEE